MRRVVGKELRNCFEAKLRADFPGFARVAATLPGGSRIYAWHLTETLSAYVMLQIPERGERFNLSIGLGDGAGIPAPIQPATYEQAVERVGLFRIGRIIYTPYRDHWWDIDPLASTPDGLVIGRELPSEAECIARVSPLVDAAMGALREYGQRFFKGALERRGFASATLFGRS